MLVDIHYRYTDTITYRCLISKDHYHKIMHSNSKRLTVFQSECFCTIYILNVKIDHFSCFLWWSLLMDIYWMGCSWLNFNVISVSACCLCTKERKIWHRDKIRWGNIALSFIENYHFKLINCYIYCYMCNWIYVLVLVLNAA